MGPFFPVTLRVSNWIFLLRNWDDERVKHLPLLETSEFTSQNQWLEDDIH